LIPYFSENAFKCNVYRYSMSNLSRLALELAAALKGFVPPFVSLDGAWCWHWRMRRGGAVHVVQVECS
jgi:hypothetical protein